jgi:hypothetical protein
VHSDALVCRGCGAEIVRGASKRERAIVGWLATGIGVVGVLAVLLNSPRFLNNSPHSLVFLSLPVACVVFHFLGRAVAQMAMRSRLRFFRSYNHQ